MPDGKDDDGQDHDIEKLDDAAIKAEEEGLKGKSEDEIRSQIIEDLELDEDEDSDLIDKLTKGKMADQKRLSTAIKQKIGYRTKLKGKDASKDGEDGEDKNKDKKADKPEKETPDVDKLVDEKLDKRDLDSLDLSDELKKEVKDYAKLHGMPVKQAFKSNYIQFLKKEEDAKVKAEEAANGSKRRSQTKSDFSDKTPADFDLTTEEGRKEWDEYKSWLKKQK